jgi:hypothetical protein
LQEALHKAPLVVVGNLLRPQRFAVLHTPGIFSDEMAGPTLGRYRVGRAVIQGLHTRSMVDRIKGTMNMARLTVFRNDGIAFFRRECTLQRLVQGIGETRGKP